jgi:hypothetical protein
MQPQRQLTSPGGIVETGITISESNHRLLFKHLKDLVFLAEAGFTTDMLKKVSPSELEYLSDPCCRGRLRFRFGASLKTGEPDFPPRVFYKIFTRGMHVQYFNGRLMIPPGSLASKDSVAMMGKRQFVQNITQTDHMMQNHDITDPVDITCRQEYTSYMSLLDHKIPANIGGVFIHSNAVLEE